MNARSLASPRRRRSFSDGLSTPPALAARRRKLRLEPLESRLLLATNFVVDSLADGVAADGDVTLREGLQPLEDRRGRASSVKNSLSARARKSEPPPLAAAPVATGSTCLKQAGNSTSAAIGPILP